MRHIGPCRNIPSHLIPTWKQLQFIQGFLFLHLLLCAQQDFTLMQLSNLEEQLIDRKLLFIWCGLLHDCNLFYFYTDSLFSQQNSIRHNLSLHSRFVRIQNEGTGKSSWWMLNPEGGKNGKSPRRRAASMDNNSKLAKSRGRATKKKVPFPLCASSLSLIRLLCNVKKLMFAR